MLGEGMHHVAHVVDNLEEAFTRARSLGALITRQPMPAVAFGGVASPGSTLTTAC
jgi:hypothetical protein